MYILYTRALSRYLKKILLILQDLKAVQQWHNLAGIIVINYQMIIEEGSQHHKSLKVKNAKNAFRKAMIKCRTTTTGT